MAKKGAASVNVEGLTRLRATLADAARSIADLRTANVQAMNLLRTRGRDTAPRRSGGLAVAVRGDVTTARGRNYVIVSDAKPYAKRVHWGYKKYGQAPQPWLYRAGRKYRRNLLAYYRAQTVHTVKKVKGA